MWAFIKKYLGWRNWAVFLYNSIFENLFVAFFIILEMQRFGDIVIIDLVIFLIFSIFSTTYGYLINDYADIELDRLHGKANTFDGDSPKKALLVTVFFLLLSVFSGWRFIDDMSFGLLWLGWLFVATFYSLPPLRFKEKGKIGLALVVSAQRLLPILMLMVALKYNSGYGMAFIAVYVFFRGTSSDINHQIEDYESDRSTQTVTFAVEQGKARVEKIFRFSLEMEKILLAGLLIFFMLNLYYLNLLPFLFLFVLTVLYLGMYGRSLIQTVKHGSLRDVNPFNQQGASIFQFLHHSFPSVILALGLLVMLCFYNWKYALFLLLFGWMRGLFSPTMIKNSFIYQTFSRMVNHG